MERKKSGIMRTQRENFHLMQTETEIKILWLTFIRRSEVIMSIT